MGIKEKMMESMMGNMSKEEKMEMMNKMMDSFFSNMTDEEKKEMMNNMMPKMMQNMMGGKKGSMMGMMRNMMGSMTGKNEESEGNDFNPMVMCKEMMANMKQSSKIATMSTPEIQGLFEDWVEQIENEIFDFIKGKEEYDVEEIAKNFKISKESAYYFLTKLAQKNKIKLQIKK